MQSDCSDQSKRWRGKDNHSTHEIARYLKITEKAVYRCMDRLKEKVQNDVWIAVFMQLFLVAIDKTFFRD